MTRQTLRRSTAAILSVGFLMLASCAADQKPPPPTSKTTVTTQPGVAGRVVRNVVTGSVTVNAIDRANRRVTLLNSAGDKVTFVAPPEVRNLDQLHPGDRVTATFERTASITVYPTSAPAGAAYAAGAGRAAPGDKPGFVMAEEYSVTSHVKEIDPVNRTATLVFSDGDTETFPVRSDVDLTRYKVGDTVVAKVSSTLMLLATEP